MFYICRTASVLVYSGQLFADMRIIPTGHRKLGQMLSGKYTKNDSFSIDFNDLILLRCQLGATFGSVWNTLGSHWVLWAHFEVTLAQVGAKLT